MCVVAQALGEAFAGPAWGQGRPPGSGWGSEADDVLSTVCRSTVQHRIVAALAACGGLRPVRPVACLVAPRHNSYSQRLLYQGVLLCAVLWD